MKYYKKRYVHKFKYFLLGKFASTYPVKSDASAALVIPLVPAGSYCLEMWLYFVSWDSNINIQTYAFGSNKIIKNIRISNKNEKCWTRYHWSFEVGTPFQVIDLDEHDL